MLVFVFVVKRKCLKSESVSWFKIEHLSDTNATINSWRAKASYDFNKGGQDEGFIRIP